MGLAGGSARPAARLLLHSADHRHNALARHPIREPCEQNCRRDHGRRRQLPPPAAAWLAPRRYPAQARRAQQAAFVFADAFAAITPPARRTAARGFARFVVPAALLKLYARHVRPMSLSP